MQNTTQKTKDQVTLHKNKTWMNSGASESDIKRQIANVWRLSTEVKINIAKCRIEAVSQLF